jgi:hypothetical protein
VRSRRVERGDAFPLHAHQRAAPRPPRPRLKRGRARSQALMAHERARSGAARRSEAALLERELEGLLAAEWRKASASKEEVRAISLQQHVALPAAAGGCCRQWTCVVFSLRRTTRTPRRVSTGCARSGWCRTAPRSSTSRHPPTRPLASLAGSSRSVRHDMFLDAPMLTEDVQGNEQARSQPSRRSARRYWPRTRGCASTRCSHRGGQPRR